MGSQSGQKIEVISKSAQVSSVKFKTIRKVKFDAAAYNKKREAKRSADVAFKQKKAQKYKENYAKNRALR